MVKVGRTPIRLADVAADRIRNMILKNEFSVGEPLNEVWLAQELGLSRTPIREAITQLESEGLLGVLPGRGAFVASLTAEDYSEINSLRIVLEPLAAEHAIGYIKEEDILKQEAEWLRLAGIVGKNPNVDLDLEKVGALDVALHGMLADECRNKRLKNILSMLRAQASRYVLITWETQYYNADTIDQHLEILKHMKSENIEALKKAIVSHLEFNNKYTINYLLKGV